MIDAVNAYTQVLEKEAVAEELGAKADEAQDAHAVYVQEVRDRRGPCTGMASRAVGKQSPRQVVESSQL